MLAPVLANTEAKKGSNGGKPSLNAPAVEPLPMEVGHGMAHAQVVYLAGVKTCANSFCQFIQVAGVVVYSVM